MSGCTTLSSLNDLALMLLLKICEQYTIEEKVIERAYKKLALDALVIQQGRLAEQKSKQFVHFYHHDKLLMPSNNVSPL